MLLVERLWRTKGWEFAVGAGPTLIVPFSTTSIPILSATHLAVCKVVFNRPRDWVDIDAMLEHGTPIDAPEALKWVGRICGDNDPRFIRLATVLTA